MYRVMLISRDSNFLDQAGGFLNRINSEIRVLPVKDPLAIETVLESSPYVDIFVCDHDPPKVDGIAVFKERSRKQDLRPFIMLALHGNEEIASQAFDVRVDYYINRDKPPMNFFMELASKIIISVEKWRVEAERVLNEKRLRALVRLAKMHNHSFNEILNYALEESVKLTISEMGYVALYDDVARKLIMHAWSQAGMEACRMKHRPIEYDLDTTGMWGDPIRLKQTVLINDYNTPHNSKGGLPMGHAPLKRLLMVPIMHNGEVVGTAGVANKKDEYNQGDIDQFVLLMEGLVSIYLERELKQESTLMEKKLRDVLRSAPVGIMVLDNDLNIIESNEFARNVVNHNNMDNIRPSISAYNNEASRYITQMSREIGSKEGTLSVEISIGRDDWPVYVRLSVSATHSDEGKISGYVAVFENITDLKDARIKLENALYQMNILDKITYNKIRSLLEDVRDKIKGSDDERSNAIMSSIGNIEDRLTFYREYRNVGIFNPEWQNIEEVVERVSKMFRLPEDMLSCKVDGIRVLADPAFDHVFEHLISNSFEHGKIVSRISIGYSIQNGDLTITYRDDGSGIPYDKKGKLFAQSPEDTEMLGMFLVKNILAATNITIAEKGVPGKGAAFEIRVPSTHYTIY